MIAAGLPAFGMYRPGSYIDRKIVFEMADAGDLLTLGCPRALVGDLRGPRRGVDIASQLAVQFASLAGGEVNEADALDGLIELLCTDRAASATSRGPVQIREVLWPTRLATMEPFLHHVPGWMAAPLLLGVDGHTGEPVWVDAESAGGGLFVAGGRRTGRSNAALSIGTLAMHLDWDVIGVAGSASSPLAEADCPFDVVSVGALDERLASGFGRQLVLIDDVHQLQLDDVSTPTRLHSAALVIATGPPSWFEGLQRTLQNCSLPRLVQGVVLMPESGTDLLLVGAKGDNASVAGASGRRAGQGLLGLHGDVAEVAIPMFE